MRTASPFFENLYSQSLSITSSRNYAFYMKNTPLAPQVSEFIIALEDIEGFLRKYGALFWADKIKRVRDIAHKSDGYSIELFFGYFGGMGSLNDLVLDAPNSVNDNLHEKLDRTYRLAETLK